LFRQYSSAPGRWLTPDPAGTGSVDPTNPQSWNGYAYVMNNPLHAIDPAGLDGFGSGDLGGYGLCGFLASAGCGFFPLGAACMGFGAGQFGCGGSPFDNCFSVS